MQNKLKFVLIAAAFGISACSQGTDMERAAVGGVAGCLVGDFLDEGSCLKGALLGAGAGALSDDINL